MLSWQNIQMPKFVRCDDDAGEAPSVLHDSHTVHLVDKCDSQRKALKDLVKGSQSPFPVAC